MLSGHLEFTPDKTLKKEAAFSLIEVMVSIAILGVALITLFELFYGSIKLARSSEDYLKATLLAQTKMNELKLENFAMETGESGEFEEEPDYHWSVTIKPYETEIERGKEKESIKEVELKVTWTFGKKKKEFNLVRLYNPMTWVASLDLDKLTGIVGGGTKTGGQASSGQAGGTSSGSTPPGSTSPGGTSPTGAASEGTSPAGAEEEGAASPHISGR